MKRMDNSHTAQSLVHIPNPHIYTSIPTFHLHDSIFFRGLWLYFYYWQSFVGSWNMQCILQTINYTLYMMQWTLHTIQCAVQCINCTLHTVLFGTLHSMTVKLYTIHYYTPHNTHFTLYTTHWKNCSLYTVLCTLQGILYSWNKPTVIFYFKIGIHSTNYILGTW